MADDAPTPEKTDRRGTPPGAGTVTPEHGGRIGNPPFVATDEQRTKVELYAKIASQDTIATLLGISVDCLQTHFREELDRGQAEAIVTVGGKLLQKAINGDGPSQRFYLATRGKGAYSRKVEVEATLGEPTGASGEAVLGALVDMLTSLADDKKRAIIPELHDNGDDEPAD